MKNENNIMKREDVRDILSQSNIIYLLDIKLVNRVTTEAPQHYIEVRYNKNKENYKIVNIYAHGKPYEMGYINLSIEQTIEFVWRNRKYFNKINRV